MQAALSWLKQKFHAKKEVTITDELKEKYNLFVKLLAENDYSLELISELQKKYHGEAIFTIPYLQGVVKKLLVGTQNIVRLLNQLTDNQYQSLEASLRKMEQEIRDVMTGKKEPVVTFTAVSLEHAYKEIADKIGDKMANLGEIKNRLGLPVPDGFALTVCAYNQFLEYNGLDVLIPEMLEKVDENDRESLMEIEHKIKGIIEKAALPPELATYLEKGYEELSQNNPGCYLSFRSSALGEDGESSFAGQYTSLLNVPPTEMEEAYKTVVGSKYNARAIYYRRKKGYRDEDIAMSVGVLRMVNAKIAGVVYMEDPNNPDKHHVIISAVWGLGQLLVDGQVSADIYVLDKKPEVHVLRQDIALKRVSLVSKPEGGIQKVRVPKEMRERPCLTEEMLKKLLSYGLELEKHYNWPQDVEWAIDENDNLYILQSRPLSLSQSKELPDIDASKFPLLLEGGQTACSGIAAGKVFRYRTEHDLVICPEGAVLVAGRTSPRFVKVMDKVSAIVTNLGSSTDHMSCLAREFQVPTIVNARRATKQLPEGKEVIVDASKCKVHADTGRGKINFKTKTQKPVLNIKVTEAYRLLNRVIPFIVPLHLLDYSSADFCPENCQTLHDVVRFCHEAALNAMFSLSEKTKLKKKAKAYRLESDIPLSIYVIDIEGNIIDHENRHKVSPEDIRCDMFHALWKGLTHENIPWKELSPGQLDLKGFFSAMSQTMVDTLATAQQMGDNYFILAKNYLNASFRFGYHFTTVDSYVCNNIQDNYVSMTFKGGAAPGARKRRRVRFIAKILSEMDFYITIRDDFIKARLKHESKEGCLEKLETLGKLIGCTRCMDMALTTDRMVDTCVEYFKHGDYTLGIFSQTPMRAQG